ncbi:hypothetical protein ACFLR1_05070 [Bacteroidota bacterium]
MKNNQTENTNEDKLILRVLTLVVFGSLILAVIRLIYMCLLN